MWQHGWTYQIGPGDSAGWKAGTGIPHTIINDSNKDESSGDDLVIILAYEVQEDDEIYWPLENSPGQDLHFDLPIWTDSPTRGEPGEHLAVASRPPDGDIVNVPPPVEGYRPTNILNAFDSTDTVGEGILVAEATSLSQETELSGRFGCNFEILSPGTRSSGQL